jgi:PTH1 family peptidyl-tRNA hydrolase
MYYIVGLGNPGEEYASTRHNAGRIALSKFIKDHLEGGLEVSKKYKALVGEGNMEKEKFTVLFPETFMNKSGTSLQTLVSSIKKAHNLIVVYDDLDLPLGKIKISFNRGSGGHRGIESIIRSIKTREFIRIRIGISPVTPSGKLKKPQGEQAVEKMILGSFSAKEEEILKKIKKEVSGALELILSEGYEAGMTHYN